jgi:hypothetical protein
MRQTVWQGEKSYIVGLRLRITSRKQAVYNIKVSRNGLLSNVRPYDTITHKVAIFLVCVAVWSGIGKSVANNPAFSIVLPQYSVTPS